MKVFMIKSILKKAVLVTFTTLLTTTFTSLQAAAFDHSYPKWSATLKKIVVAKEHASQVKYTEFLKDHQDFDAFLKEVSSVQSAEYSAWSNSQKLAFLFNSYNAFTIKLITDNLVKNPNLKSIKDLGSLFSSPWKIQFFDFLGETSSLDHIEQELARPKFDDPRLHFAFNCASIGCPALGTEAFLPDKLDPQLDAAAKNFLADQTRNVYLEKQNELQLSSIFKWYGKDFENSKKYGPLRKFLATHMALSDGAKKSLLSGDMPIKFLEYNWQLNKN
jgi:hypothetical protein